MRRIIITILFVAMLAMSWQQARGFALLGPAPFTPAGDLSGSLPASFSDTWQTIVLGYGLPYEDSILAGGPTFLGDLGGPKNVGIQGTKDSIGQGYRRNDKVVYYSYDANFQSFFGPQGEAAADQAFAIMNAFFNTYSNGVDGYSANLTEFPFISQHFNGTAQGLYLTDLKSVLLHCLVEQMGLAEPERYTWTLADREVISPPGCPFGNFYLVLQRNYDTVDQPLTGPQTGNLFSPYVNNILYTYSILEDCGTHGPLWTAITVPYSTDTTIPEYTAVAANDYEGGSISGLGGLQVGGFYTGLTEDDAAGLRYLMSSNSYAEESPASGSLLEATNFNLVPLETSDLGALLLYAQTNPPAALLTQFPNLVINSFSNYYTIVSNPIVFSYFTNYPGSSVGSPPVFVVGTNGYALALQTNYVYTFDNLVIVHYHTNTVAKVVTTSLAELNGAPAGTGIYTNTTTKNITLTNVPSGDYYLLPPNSCGFDIAKTLVSNYLAGTTTNVIATATNATTGFVGTESIVTYFTNNWYEYYACNLQTSSPAYYQGIQHIQFVRVDADVDSLTGIWVDSGGNPITVTNTYTMVLSSNLQAVTRTFQRIVTQPDILITAAPDNQPNTFNGTVTRNIFFEIGNILNEESGPGVIDGQSAISFNEVGNAWWNGPFSDTNTFLVGTGSDVNQTTGIPSLLWASFDGTTNPPVIYPTSLTASELESQMLITISPSAVPNGTNGVPYTPTQFTAQGGTPSYNWSASGLPSGLTFYGGLLSGTPNDTNGTYMTQITLMDSSLPTNTISLTYPITILPNSN
jgi:hypothetical protein